MKKKQQDRNSEFLEGAGGRRVNRSLTQRPEDSPMGTRPGDSRQAIEAAFLEERRKRKR